MMPALQTEAPLLAALRSLAGTPDAPFYCPGHKRGHGAWPPFATLVGAAALNADLPELPTLDNLFAPTGAIAAAQALAAEAFGADRSWFLANGSSCGVIAAILAACRAGEKILLPRNCHQSAISGLILSGAIPVFVSPAYEAERDLSYGLTPESIATALEAHPDIKAIFLVSPTYQGICPDVAAIAQLAHTRGIPLLVDEAHGGHFAFHPELPPSALELGADLSVQSLHKTAGAMTQAAILHLKANQGDRLTPAGISRALQWMQSTSPNYLLLASLDAARQQLALEGKTLLDRALELADLAHTTLAKVSGVSVLSEPVEPCPGWRWRDRTRLTISLQNLGIDGFAADEWLLARGVAAELPLPQHLTFVITHGNRPADVEHLITAVTALACEFPKRLRDRELLAIGRAFAALPPTRLLLSPRQASQATTRTLPAVEAIGHPSAETICPYPPGIPVLLPGETITAEALAYLQAVYNRGGTLSGCSDSSLETLQVAC